MKITVKTKVDLKYSKKLRRIPLVCNEGNQSRKDKLHTLQLKNTLTTHQKQNLNNQN